jgi:hypothetical protein
MPRTAKNKGNDPHSQTEKELIPSAQHKCPLLTASSALFAPIQLIGFYLEI